jgi:hypothetical protein
MAETQARSSSMRCVGSASGWINAREEFFGHSGHKMSRKFNDEMRKLGCEQRETGFWNNRPAWWWSPSA